MGKMLENIIPKILNNKFERKPQEGKASFYPKRAPEDGLIDWNKPIIEIYNLIRALTKTYPALFLF